MGPWSYAKHLVSGSRLPFTAAYFGSIALTLYFAIGVSKSMIPILSFGFTSLSHFGLALSSALPISPFQDHLSISLFVAHRSIQT
jgi:hypothetical protein